MKKVENVYAGVPTYLWRMNAISALELGRPSLAIIPNQRILSRIQNQLSALGSCLNVHG